MKKTANFLRLFWGCVFLGGVMINVVLGITSSVSYDKGGAFAWPNFLQNFWVDSVIPNMMLFIFLFAIIELMIGILILNKQRFAKLGLAGAAIFGIGLLLLGLGAEWGNWTARIPNIIFEVTILYTLFFNYDRTLLQTMHPKKELTHTSVIGS